MGNTGIAFWDTIMCQAAIVILDYRGTKVTRCGFLIRCVCQNDKEARET